MSACPGLCPAPIHLHMHSACPRGAEERSSPRVSLLISDPYNVSHETKPNRAHPGPPDTRRREQTMVSVSLRLEGKGRSAGCLDGEKPLAVAANPRSGKGALQHLRVRGAGRSGGNPYKRALHRTGWTQLAREFPWEWADNSDLGSYTREKFLLVLPVFPLHSTCCSEKNCERAL